jgi:hypothetical protein
MGAATDFLPAAARRAEGIKVEVPGSESKPSRFFAPFFMYRAR